jgi:hypothetical protein
MLNPDYKEMLSAFCDEGVEFLVVGAYAMAAHGVPRATGDIDLWIARTPENSRSVLRALVRFGAPVHEWKAEDFQVPDMVFQLGVEPRRIDILTSIEGIEFAEAWPHRVFLKLDGLSVPVLSVSDLVRNKETAARPQDLADVARLKEQRIQNPDR